MSFLRHHLRKWLGYQFLPSQATESIENFYREWLNRYLNFHRPCAFATLEPDRRGKLRKVYRQWQTPLEKLLSLPAEQRGLRDGVSIDRLEQQAKAESDTEFAELLQAQRTELQRTCKDLAIRWGPR